MGYTLIAVKPRVYNGLIVAVVVLGLLTLCLLAWAFSLKSENIRMRADNVKLEQKARQVLLEYVNVFGRLPVER